MHIHAMQDMMTFFNLSYEIDHTSNFLEQASTWNQSAFKDFLVVLTSSIF